MLPFILMLLIAAADSTAADSATNTVTITAVPSTFTPSTITLHRGVTTKLVFARTEGVHEIESDALGIPKTMLVPGKDVTLAVTPTKDGTFVLHCEIVCGNHHDTMALSITVEG